MLCPHVVQHPGGVGGDGGAAVRPLPLRATAFLKRGLVLARFRQAAAEGQPLYVHGAEC
jgi:hypothetical protein